MKAAFLGDECAAAGFRLAGLACATPVAGGEEAAFRDAVREAALVLVACPVAARLPSRLLRHAIARAAPPVVVVPDLTGAAPWPDPAADLGRQLGLEVK